MTVPPIVNAQITDAVTQANVKVVGEAPALALGSVYQTAAHSMGLLFENAVSAQQSLNAATQAAANQGIAQLYAIDTAGSTGPALDIKLLEALAGKK